MKRNLDADDLRRLRLTNELGAAVPPRNRAERRTMLRNRRRGFRMPLSAPVGQRPAARV